MPVKALVSPRADALLSNLVSRLQEIPDDPFRREIIVVPSAVYRDWLSEQLAGMLKCPDGRAGVVANVDFLLPGEFYPLVEVDSNANPLGFSLPDQLTTACHVLVLMEQYPSLVPSFSDSTDRMALAIKVAQLFERYAIDRPEMLAAWNSKTATDGDSPLIDRHKWQFELWNLLGERLRVATGAVKAHQMPKREVSDTIEHRLGGRLSFFGLEVLSPRAVRAMTTLVGNADVFLYGTLPSQHVLTVGREVAARLQQPGNHKREIFSDFVDPRHPLLRTWSASAYETAALLWCVTNDVTFVEADYSKSLLGAFQRDIALATELDAQEPGKPITDGSIQVHRCHGLVRQVEVARDALLHILDSDQSITLRDVLIVVPGIEQIAALIQPIFEIPIAGTASSKYPLRLSTALLDGATVDGSDVSQIAFSFLRFVDSRCTRSEIKGIFNIDAVRIALGFDAEALVKIDRWLENIDVRWGISARQRERAGYPLDFRQGSWAWAVERLAAGAFVQAPEPVEIASGLTPYDDVGSGDLDTIVQFVSILTMIEEFQDFGRQPRLLSEWIVRLGQVLQRLVPNDEEFADDLEDAQSVSARLLDLGKVSGQSLFSAREVLTIVSNLFRGRRGQVRRWGDLVRVGSLGRMRGVPARVVILLGLDDAALAGGSIDGDDIIAESPRIGERDRRADERLALLATVAAAREYLVVTAEGYTVTSNSDVAPSIPQTELLEAVQKSTRAFAAVSTHVSRPLVVSHSRQLAHPVNLGVAAKRKEPSIHDFLHSPWTFDQSAVVLAKASSQTLLKSNDIAELELPPLAGDEQESELRIADLIDAIRRPLRVLLRNRLGVVFKEIETAPSEDMPLWPDALERASLGREWIEWKVRGESHEEVVRRLRLAGRLPAGQLGSALVAEMRKEIDQMFDKAGGLPKSSEDVVIDLAVAGTRVRDRIVLMDGELREIDYARHHPSRKVVPWVRLAAVVRQLGGRDIVARVVTRSNSKDKNDTTPVLTVLRMIGADDAERVESANQVLALTSQFRQLALRSVVPLFDRTTWAVIAGESPASVRSDFERDCERPEYRWTRYLPPLTELLDQPAVQPGEELRKREGFGGLTQRLAECLRATTSVDEVGVE
jgi:exodeoxyribonuclease V gamma subunit